MAMFVVDSVKRLDVQVEESLKRLQKNKVDPESQKILDKIRDESFSEEKFNKGEYSIDDEERQT